MFDISALSTTTEATYDLELVHPTKGKTSLFIRHLASTAPTVEAFAREQGNAVLLKNYEAERNGDDDAAPTIERAEERTAELLTVATVKWFEKRDGKEIDGWPQGEGRMKFTPKAANSLYADPGYRWARKQLDASVADLTRFLGK